MNSEVAGCNRIARELGVLASGHVRWEHTPETAVLGDAAKGLNCSALELLPTYLLLFLPSFLCVFNIHGLGSRD